MEMCFSMEEKLICMGVGSKRRIVAATATSLLR